MSGCNGLLALLLFIPNLFGVLAERLHFCRVFFPGADSTPLDTSSPNSCTHRQALPHLGSGLRPSRRSESEAKHSDAPGGVERGGEAGA